MSNSTHRLWRWRNYDMKWTDGITFAKFKGLKKTDTVKKNV